MIDLSKYTPAIQVKLEPGIYLFSDGSARGKTYLCSLLHKLKNRERVDGHRYPDEFKPAELLDNAKRDLVFLDRYDMYCGKGANEIISFAQNGGVVLIDCKSHSLFLPVEPCLIRMYQDRLVVT
ncbi:MAG: hypothetical protein K2K53_01825 [Oscillospiraceae bacterium]|nr:hypothetical protein [Oscillospiraceae bacterium]